MRSKYSIEKLRKKYPLATANLSDLELVLDSVYSEQRLSLTETLKKEPRDLGQREMFEKLYQE